MRQTLRRAESGAANQPRGFYQKVVRARTFRVIAILGFTLILVERLVAGCSNDQFEKLYDLYFPKRSSYADSQYRSYFDSILFGAPLPRSYRKRDRCLYHAFRCDP